MAESKNKRVLSYQRFQGSAPKKVDFSSYMYSFALMAVALVLFGQVRHFELLNFDDGTIVIRNPVVYDPARWKECFSWAIFTPHFKPVTFLLWQLEYRLAGANPAVFHFNNAILHAFNSLLVFLICRQLFPKILAHGTASPEPAAFFAGLIFAVHPMHVESVAWVVERKDVLSTFFFLGGWLSYIKYLSSGNKIALAGGAALYMLALFSKSMAITLLGILFITDIAWKRQAGWKILLEKIPYFFVALLASYYFGLITDFGAQAGGFSLKAASIQDADVSNLGQRDRGIQSILVMSAKLLLWFVHMIVPVKLQLGYDSREILGWLGKAINAVPFLLVAAGFLVVRYRKTLPWLFFGIAFYCITILPALAINKTGGAGIFLADRYTYIPLLGFAVALVSFIYSIQPVKPLITSSITAFVCLIFSILTIRYLPVWLNSEKLWSNTISMSKCNPQGYSGRASVYFEQNKFDLGYTDANQALNCDSNFVPAYLVRGVLANWDNKKEVAYSDVQHYLKMGGQHRYEALMLRSSLLLSRGKTDSALTDLEMAIKLDSTRPTAYRNRSAVYLNMRRYDDALADVDRYERIIGGDTTTASANFRKLVLQVRDAQLNKQPGNTTAKAPAEPDNNQNMAPAAEGAAPTPYSELVKNVYNARAKGDHAGVISWTTKCIAQNATDPDLYAQRAVAYLNMKAYKQALADLDKSITLSSKYPQVYYFRSLAHKGLMNYPQALADAEKAKQSGFAVDDKYLADLRRLSGGKQ